MKISVIGLKLIKEYEVEILGDVDVIYDVETASTIFCNLIGGKNVEHVAMLCLDSASKIINSSFVSIGKVDCVYVSIPQIIKIALLSNASKLLIAHNHPCGVLEVTNYDIDLTKKIGAMAKLFDIELVDSLIVSESEAVSIREKIGERKNESQ